MVKPGALVMAGVMAAVATGVYYGLNVMPPDMLPAALKRTHTEDIPVASRKDPKPELAPTATAPAETSAPAAVPAEAPQSEAPAENAQAEAAAAPAAAPPPAEPAAEPAVEAAAEPAAEPAPAPAPKKKPARPKTAVASAAPATSEPAPPSTPSSSGEGSMAGTGEAPSAPVKKPPPAADAIKPWWPDPSKMPEQQLKLQYAGQVQGQPAIALLFSTAVNMDTLRKYAEVRSSSGEPVPGQWELGNNPRLAVFRSVAAGRYTVILSAPLAGTDGYMLGTELQGPVYIQ